MLLHCKTARQRVPHVNLLANLAHSPSRVCCTHDAPAPVTIRWRRVTQQLVDLTHYLWRQLWQELERPEVFLHLQGLAGPADRGGDVWVLQGPGQGQLRQAAAKAVSQGLEG